MECSPTALDVPTAARSWLEEQRCELHEIWLRPLRFRLRLCPQRRTGCGHDAHVWRRFLSGVLHRKILAVLRTSRREPPSLEGGLHKAARQYCLREGGGEDRGGLG